MSYYFLGQQAALLSVSKVLEKEEIYEKKVWVNRLGMMIDLVEEGK